MPDGFPRPRLALGAFEQRAVRERFALAYAEGIGQALLDPELGHAHVTPEQLRFWQGWRLRRGLSVTVGDLDGEEVRGG